MLLIYYGGDRVKSLSVAEKTLLKVKADEIISYDETTVNVETLLSLAEQQALFGGVRAIKLDNVLSNIEVGETILKNLEVLKKSPSTFIFLEDSLNAETAKSFKKYAQECLEFKLPKKREEFNIFKLGDAFGMRDKKAFWVLYTRAISYGKTGEEIAGTLFWQIKSMIIVEAGGGTTLSPYVLNNCKRFVRNFKEGELQVFARTLIDKYHQAHRGRGDLETALERFVLSI